MTAPMLLFVYGTLRRSYTRLPQSARHLSPPHILHTSGEWVSEAKVENYALFDIGSYPGVVPCENSVVHGDLFRIESSAQILKVLDEYEGIVSIYEEPYEYRRVAAVVIAENGEHIRAWMYVYNWNTRDVTWIKNGDYVDYCWKRVSNQEGALNENATN